MAEAILVAGAVASTAAGAATSGALGATAFTLAGTAVSVGALVGAGIGVGGTLLAASLAETPGPGSGARVGRETTVAEAAGRRWRVLGETRLAGAWLLHDASSDDELWQLIAVAAHPVAGVIEHRLDNEAVTLDAQGWVTSPEKWAGRVQILVRDGAHAETFPELVEAFPYWTPAHRGIGVAQVLIRQRPVPDREMDRAYPRRRLQWSGLVRGDVGLWDPRSDTTGWSDNAALHLLRFLLLPPLEGGCGLAPERIDLASFRRGADLCDEPVALAGGGSEPRYRVNGVLAHDADRRKGFAALLGACDADLWIDPRGRLSLRMSAADHVARLAAGDVLAFATAPGAPAYARVNQGVPRYASAAHDHLSQTAPPVALPRRPGEPARQRSYELPLVASHGQAQRIVARRLRRETPRYAMEVTATLAGLDAEPTGAVALDLPGAPRVGLWRVLRRTLRPAEGVVSLELASIPDDYDAWDRDDVAPPPLPVLSALDGLLEPPSGVTVTPVVIGLKDGARGLALRARFAGLSDEAVMVEMQTAEAGTGEWQAAGSAVASAGLVTSGVLTDDRRYDLRLRFAGPGGRATPWTRIEAREVATLAETPQPPTDLVATPKPGGVVLAATAPASGPVWRLRFRVGETDDYAASAHAGHAPAANGERVSVELDGLSVQTRHAWAVARSDADLDGSPTPSAAFQPLPPGDGP